ncbi:MAG: isoprenylcysteine carboxylmethyltransferase family protein, partial [Anaerolineales bacterium]
ILIPLFITVAGPALDRFLSISLSLVDPWVLVIGIFFMLVGGFFALWSIVDQLFKARGTPLPIMPTQELLISGPFKLCRNPMSFGTILLYLGLSILIVSPGAAAIVIVLSSLLLTYIKRVEERELEARFGQAYRSYKEQTPFLIPRKFGGS